VGVIDLGSTSWTSSSSNQFDASTLQLSADGKTLTFVLNRSNDSSTVSSNVTLRWTPTT
jgi:hypothetical protein